MVSTQTSLILPPVQEAFLVQGELAAATLRVLVDRPDDLTPDETCLLGDAQWASGQFDAAALSYETARAMTARSRLERVVLQPGLIKRYLDTMERMLGGQIDEKRLRTLRILTETVLTDDVPGDLIETGVSHAGAGILMRAVLAAYAVTDRRVVVADMVENAEPPEVVGHPANAGCFAKYDLLDEQVVFLKGGIRKTLPHGRIAQLAILHLDGDRYGPTKEALAALYGSLSPGGFCIVDDGTETGCQQAIMEFRMAEGITAPVIDIDGCGFYWRKHK